MANGLVEVLGTAAPEIVEVVAPVVYDVLSSGPNWMTKQKVKAIVRDVQLTTMQIQALKKIVSEENLFKRFLFTELKSSIALIKSIGLTSDVEEQFIAQAVEDTLKKLRQMDFMSGFCNKYKIC